MRFGYIMGTVVALVVAVALAAALLPGEDEPAGGQPAPHAIDQSE